MKTENITAAEELLNELGSIIESNPALRSNAQVTNGSIAVESADGVPLDVNAELPIPRFVPPEITPLHNATAPAYDNHREKYEHRMAAILKSAGLTNVEIARELGISPVTVGYIVKQPWAQSLILERIHGSGDKAMQRLQEETLGAAERLIAISKDCDNAETKRKANNDILDRKYGRPNQPYSQSTKTADECHDSELVRIAKGN